MADNQAINVDPTNFAQLEAWNGTEGDYWAKRADHFGKAVSRANHARRSSHRGERLGTGCGPLFADSRNSAAVG